MRKFMLLLGAVLCLSVVAATAQAQENTVTFLPSSPAAPAASPQGPGGSDTSWQLAFGYQYDNLNPSAKSGKSFNTSGLNISTAWFVNNWLGLEGDLGTGFGGSTGSTTFPPNLQVKNLFIGGGPHLAFGRNNRFEPWVHGLIGWEHLRYTETATGFGTNDGVGWVAGGGVDIHFNPRTAVRGEFDYVGTDFNVAISANYQFVVGLVLNF